MIADHDRDRQSRDFQNMIVSDRRSWFGKMIVSDRRSRKKVSCLTLISIIKFNNYVTLVAWSADYQAQKVVNGHHGFSTLSPAQSSSSTLLT